MTKGYFPRFLIFSIFTCISYHNTVANFFTPESRRLQKFHRQPVLLDCAQHESKENFLKIRGGYQSLDDDESVTDESGSDFDLSEDSSDDEDVVIKMVQGKKILNEKLKSTKKEGVLDKIQKFVYKKLDENFNDITKDESFPMVINIAKQVVASMVVVKVVNSLNHEDPQAVTRARFSYIGYLLFAQILIFFSRLKVISMNDQTEVEVPPPPANPFSGLASSPEDNQSSDTEKSSLEDTTKDGNEQQVTKMTVKEYDCKELDTMRNALVMPTLLYLYLHFKKGFVKPLMIQAFMGVYQIITAPIIQIHIFGKSAEGPLSRPFNKSGMLKNMTRQTEESASASTVDSGDEGDGEDKESFENPNQEDEEQEQSDTSVDEDQEQSGASDDLETEVKVEEIHDDISGDIESSVSEESED